MSTGGRSNLGQALAYARHGWPVFPIRPGGKTPAIASAHPKGDPAAGACTGGCGRDGHGFYDATTDPDRIRAWWGSNPARNVAVATGWPGPDVLDVDRHGAASGFAALRELRAAGLVGQPSAMIRTPSGGAHLYFRGSQQGNGSLPGRHIDFRSAGGYVVVPPSTVGGRPYVVVHSGATPDRIDWAQAREYLDPQPQRRPWARPPAGQRQSLDHLVGQMAAQDPGSQNRNNFLYWAACRVLDHGQPDVLEHLADAAMAAGLTRREADRTIASAHRTARQDPHARRGPDRPSRRQEVAPQRGPFRPFEQARAALAPLSQEAQPGMEAGS